MLINELSCEMALPKDKWIRRFIISETSRHKKGFTIYKVSSLMYLKSSPDIVSKVFVWKRYSDFKKLHNALQSLYSTLQIKEPFPLFPKPKFFGRFEPEVIEERRVCALKFLEFIGRYSALYTSEIFVTFFEINSLDKQYLDSSQSLSSDTSEDDRAINCGNQETAITSTSDFPQYFCSSKLIPTVVTNKNNIKLNNTNSKIKTLKTAILRNRNEQSSKNNTKKNSNDVANGFDTLSSKKNDLKSKDTTDSSMVVINNGLDLTQTSQTDPQYMLIAGAHMSAAFRHEAIAEYEEAFTQYKLGIAHLINGVQTEVDQEEKKKIQGKITKCLQRAEKLYNRHLNCNVSVLHKPITELQNYKVIELVESVMLVKDTLQGFKRVIKTVEKIADCQNDNSYILRGKIPYMVQLYSCIQTDSTVFLILQYMSRGKLWDFAKCNYKVDDKRDSFIRRHSRSFSCNAVIQNDSLKTSCTQEDFSKIKITHKDKNYSMSEENELVTEDTKELVENAQKLLQSVNDTLKRSNSIASRLNESKCFLYKPNVNREIVDSVSNWKESLKQDCLSVEKNEDAKVNRELSKVFVSDSCKELNNDKCKQILVENNNETKNNIKILENFKTLTNLKIPVTKESRNETISFKKIENQSFKKIENYFLEIEKQMWVIPESTVRIWAAEILLTLEALHQQDIIILDLRPDNILIDEHENVSITYIVPRKDTQLLRLKKPYSSPELCMFTPPISISTSADVWSFGVLLYELLTGFDFQTKHPGQFHSHSLVNIPDNLSENARSLLLNILKYQPSDRLTIPEIKQHSFFIEIDWLELLNVEV